MARLLFVGVLAVLGDAKLVFSGYSQQEGGESVYRTLRVFNDGCDAVLLSDYSLAADGRTETLPKRNLVPGSSALVCNDPQRLSPVKTSVAPTASKYAPVITIMGPKVLTLVAKEAGEYDDEGAKCSDLVEGEINEEVVTSGDLIDLTAPSNKPKYIDYECTASDGTTSTAKRTVYVVPYKCAAFATLDFDGTATIELLKGKALHDKIGSLDKANTNLQARDVVTCEKKEGSNSKGGCDDRHTCWADHWTCRTSEPESFMTSVPANRLFSSCQACGGLAQTVCKTGPTCLAEGTIPRAIGPYVGRCMPKVQHKKCSAGAGHVRHCVRETEDYVSTCSHVHCTSTPLGITKIHHDKHELYGDQHTCGGDLLRDLQDDPDQNKCGCQCYSESIGSADFFADILIESAQEAVMQSNFAEKTRSTIKRPSSDSSYVYQFDFSNKLSPRRFKSQHFAPPIAPLHPHFKHDGFRFYLQLKGSARDTPVAEFVRASHNDGRVLLPRIPTTEDPKQMLDISFWFKIEHRSCVSAGAHSVSSSPQNTPHLVPPHCEEASVLEFLDFTSDPPSTRGGMRVFIANGTDTIMASAAYTKAGASADDPQRTRFFDPVLDAMDAVPLGRVDDQWHHVRFEMTGPCSTPDPGQNIINSLAVFYDGRAIRSADLGYYPFNICGRRPMVNGNCNREGACTSMLDMGISDFEVSH